MKFKHEARLVVSNFECSPEEITRLLETPPTQAWLRGDLVSPSGTLRRKANGWQLDSRVDPTSADVPEAIQDVLAQLPDQSLFARLPPGSYKEMSCTIFTYDHRPGVHLTSDIIKALASYDVELDLDIYDFSSESDDDASLT